MHCPPAIAPHRSTRPFPTRRLWLLVLYAAVLAAMLLGTSNAQRRSGGGFGGRSSSPSSRYTPTAPHVSGGYIPVPIPVPVPSYGYGGGYGFSHGGFGFGGVIVLVVLIGGGFLLFRRFASTAGPGRQSSGQSSGLFTGRSDREASAVSVQVILSEGDDVKRALQQVARSGDAETDAGLSALLNEAALVLLRHPERWTYGALLHAQGDDSQMASQVGAWASQARAAFTDQTTSRYATTGFSPATNLPPRAEHQPGERFLAVTIMVAAASVQVPAAPTANAAQLRAALITMSGIVPEDLLRTEVVWSPDVEGEFLSEDQAIMYYPALTKL